MYHSSGGRGHKKLLRNRITYTVSVCVIAGFTVHTNTDLHIPDIFKTIVEDVVKTILVFTPFLTGVCRGVIKS